MGIALTAVGAAGAVLGAALLGVGARYWPQPNDDGLTVLGRANLSVNLQSVGLAVMLGSLGILGPGIGALATREPAGERRARGPPATPRSPASEAVDAGFPSWAIRATLPRPQRIEDETT